MLPYFLPPEIPPKRRMNFINNKCFLYILFPKNRCATAKVGGIRFGNDYFVEKYKSTKKSPINVNLAVLLFVNLCGEYYNSVKTLTNDVLSITCNRFFAQNTLSVGK